MDMNDTPLGVMRAMHRKQMQSHQAHVVLRGAEASGKVTHSSNCDPLWSLPPSSNCSLACSLFVPVFILAVLNGRARIHAMGLTHILHLW